MTPCKRVGGTLVVEQQRRERYEKMSGKPTKGGVHVMEKKVIRAVTPGLGGRRRTNKKKEKILFKEGKKKGFFGRGSRTRHTGIRKKKKGVQHEEVKKPEKDRFRKNSERRVHGWGKKQHCHVGDDSIMKPKTPDQNCRGGTALCVNEKRKTQQRATKLQFWGRRPKRR